MSKESKKRLPFVSFITPTLNAEKFLGKCLTSIRKQDYPRSRYEILVIDGGSRDRTLAIAKKFGAKILTNPRVIAEFGKSIGIQKSRGQMLALIDADNEIVQSEWLREVIKPLTKHPGVWGIESPWLLRASDGLINKYFTLLKIADPLARRLHPKKMREEEFDDYIIYEERFRAPVVGANGFLWRKNIIFKIGAYSPKFEEVNYAARILRSGYFKFARHKKVGIYHDYCSSVGEYIKKRLKIGRKFLERKKKKEPTWVDESDTFEFIKAIVYNISIVGPLVEALREYKKSGELAWFLHPFFSFLTIVVYFYTTLEFFLRKIFKT